MTQEISMWPIIKRIDDDAQNVAKFVFTKPDAVAEAVLYRYPTYRERTVICCSTQAGCPVGCRFCGAGDAFVRSLTADEIVAQVTHLLALTDCDPREMGRLQIMFMSMGEPLLNLRGLDPAVHALHAAYPNAALLISTSAPAIDYEDVIALSIAVPTVGLQFSVHESTDEARDAALARIQGSTSYDDLKPAQLVIEAATENYELKLKILKQIDAIVAPEVIIVAAATTGRLPATAAASSENCACVTGASATLIGTVPPLPFPSPYVLSGGAPPTEAGGRRG